MSHHKKRDNKDTKSKQTEKEIKEPEEPKKIKETETRKPNPTYKNQSPRKRFPNLILIPRLIQMSQINQVRRNIENTSIHR